MRLITSFRSFKKLWRKSQLLTIAQCMSYVSVDIVNWNDSSNRRTVWKNYLNPSTSLVRLQFVPGNPYSLKYLLGNLKFQFLLESEERQVNEPVNTTLFALDHDMTKASLTPSVYLKCDIPESAAQSSVKGEVTNVVNNSVFETSSPFRHATSLAK